MTQEEAQDKARNNFKSGMNCAQSVFSVFAEELGMNLETALKVSQGFGGGMCRMREVCGCVSVFLYKKWFDMFFPQKISQNTYGELLPEDGCYCYLFL